jgi:Fungal specific transcription factor domain
MSSYLSTALQQPQSGDRMLPNSASRSFASPTSPRNSILEEKPELRDLPGSGGLLTATQEAYFLSLFWQSYHCTYQILDEDDFREHYKSLWAASGTSRKPSALVDIVLALCMQYGIAFRHRSDVNTDSNANVDSNDAAIAGRWFYRRCQILLASDLESPSIMTLQCHIFSVVYLCNASFQNMAHSTLAVAVRTAQILGFHLEPSEDIPPNQRELRKRLWWTVYAVEAKTCMKLGRPWSVQLSQVTCTLPADGHEVAYLSGSYVASFGENVTWLTYSLQNIRLVLTARMIYVAFYDKCADILSTDDGRSLYNDQESLEACAEFLSSSMRSLQTWSHNVPDGLKTKREGSGEPFSTDRSALIVELFAPLWLQRQRLLLELLYHNLSMNLYRPFISFSPISTSCTPLAERNALWCVKHAMAITHTMRQMLTETDTLSGWHECFQWQWNATLSMIGFIIAHPVNASTTLVRESVNSAIDVFERMSKNFAMATSAADVVRDLTAKADRLRNALVMMTPSFSSDVDDLQTYKSHIPTDSHFNTSGIVSPLDDDSIAMFQNTLADSMGSVFMIDSYNSFEPLYADSSNMSDAWTFTQD